MEMKASDIQKQRIAEIEAKAGDLVSRCDVMYVASVNEKGYPRICCVNKLKNNGFKDIYFVTSKRSEKQGKAKHFEDNAKASVCFRLDGDSLTLVGNARFVTDRSEMKELWNDSDKEFFPKGLDDPKIRFIHFHAIEATFWIGHKFRTVQYK